MDRVLIIGLDEPEYQAIRDRTGQRIVYHDLPPRVKVVEGRLLVERPNSWDSFVPVSQVIFHGIFEDDYPLITALALWGGPCLPDARGMMDCRQRIPCLVRALQVTRFGTMRRGYADRGTNFEATSETVAKWGEWHCGENKVKFTGGRTTDVPTVYEPFIRGAAVRLHLMGDRAWQIHMEGDDWLKSIHHSSAAFMDIDPDLLDDARRLQAHFGLQQLAVDYMIAEDGTKHMLEVNHIPNVTVFPEIRTAYLDFVTEWLAATVPAQAAAM
jgi:hypothetical protein